MIAALHFDAMNSMRVFVMNFESANAGCVVDSGILEVPDLLSALASTGQKFYIHLNMMTGNLLAIALGVDFPHPRSARQSADAIAFEDAANASF